MQVAKPDLGKTLTAVLDIKTDNGSVQLPVKENLQGLLKNATLRSEARLQAQKLLDSFNEDLQKATWYFEGWLDNTLSQLPQAFDQACERWRSQYRAAVAQRELHHRIIGDHSRPEQERNHSRRLRDQAETQDRKSTRLNSVTRSSRMPSSA